MIDAQGDRQRAAAGSQARGRGAGDRGRVGHGQRWVAGGILVALMGGAALAVWIDEGVAQRYVIIVVDVSPTSAKGTRCSDVRRIVQLELAGLHGGSLQLVLMSTGDRTTGNQPLYVGPVGQGDGVVSDYEDAAIPFRGSAAFSEGQVQASNREQVLLGEVDRRCQGMVDRDESPIFDAVAAALKDLERVVWESPGVTAKVYARTDGLEEADSRISGLLYSTASVGKTEERLNNNGVDVVFCGVSARQVRPSAAPFLPSLNRIEAVFGAEMTARARFWVESSCAVTPAPVARSGNASHTRTRDGQR